MSLTKKQAIEILESFDYKCTSTENLYHVPKSNLYASFADGDILIERYLRISLSLIDEMILVKLLNTIHIIENKIQYEPNTRDI